MAGAAPQIQQGVRRKAGGRGAPGPRPSRLVCGPGCGGPGRGETESGHRPGRAGAEPGHLRARTAGCWVPGVRAQCRLVGVTLSQGCWDTWPQRLGSPQRKSVSLILESARLRARCPSGGPEGLCPRPLPSAPLPGQALRQAHPHLTWRPPPRLGDFSLSLAKTRVLGFRALPVPGGSHFKVLTLRTAVGPNFQARWHSQAGGLRTWVCLLGGLHSAPDRASGWPLLLKLDVGLVDLPRPSWYF